MLGSLFFCSLPRESVEVYISHVLTLIEVRWHPYSKKRVNCTPKVLCLTFRAQFNEADAKNINRNVLCDCDILSNFAPYY